MPWSIQSGDPAVFALSLAFTENPEGLEDAIVAEESVSWGHFRIWAGGENLCAHHELGEVVDAAHWYMLPFMEWLVENWNAAFHEERLPIRNSGVSAAGALSATRRPPPNLTDEEDFDWLDQWGAWWARHNVRAGRAGGLFPDLYIRRYGDQCEISTGSEPLPGIPPSHLFTSPDRSFRLPLLAVAGTVHNVLLAAASELLARLPGSERIQSLKQKVDNLATQDGSRDIRLAYLTGLADDADAFFALARAVDAAFAGVGDEVKSDLLAESRDTDLVTVGSPYARLLYGSQSPNITSTDVARLATALLENYVIELPRDRMRRIEELGVVPDDARFVTAAEQGSILGELVCAELTEMRGSQVEVRAIVESLGIAVDELSLSDSRLRAVTVFGPHQSPRIFCNANFHWGRGGRVTRFTLAHELCHLLYDRDFADELAVATGPWAPVDIEKRANAFAAAFLMPTWLLNSALLYMVGSVSDALVLRRVADGLNVSQSALQARLVNLGVIERDDAEQLGWQLESWRRSRLS